MQSKCLYGLGLLTGLCLGLARGALVVGVSTDHLHAFGNMLMVSSSLAACALVDRDPFLPAFEAQTDSNCPYGTYVGLQNGLE